MELNRSLTSTVYVVNGDKVLLHVHKKFESLFPLGGHMLPNELPHETAVREVYEESGLRVSLYNIDESLPFINVKQLIRPAYVLLENIGQDVENIDFIFFATTNTYEVKPQDMESNELYWLSVEELISNSSIKNHIRLMALEAIRVIKMKVETSR